MIYTAVFENNMGDYSLETHVSSHDRSVAWAEIYKKRLNSGTCLVLLIDGQANVRTYQDVVDID